jgi:hypothetical protein
MDATKCKYKEPNIKRYWLIYIPLTIAMLLLWRFPLRILLRETSSDLLFYSSLSFAFLLSAFNVYRLSKWKFRGLISVILLCVGLSAWQVFDLAIVRAEVPSISFENYGNSPDGFGRVWYNVRMKNDAIDCHSIFEKVIGNMYIAIAIETQHTRWYACGG